MANVDVFKDSHSGYLGGKHMHPETWRVHGNEAQMVDTSEHGPLSPAVDDSSFNDCAVSAKRRWPNAPGFVGKRRPECKPGDRSGALDGQVSAAR